MGCSASTQTSKVAASKAPKSRQTTEDFLYTYVDEKSLRLAYDFILKDCNLLLCNGTLVPSICLTEKSFPVINARLPVDEEGETFINLPIVTAAFGNKGRVICFPHGEIICGIPAHQMTAKFFENALAWLGHQRSAMTPVLLFGFNQQFNVTAKDILHHFGFFVETSQKLTNLNTYRIIFVPSSIDVHNSNIYSKLIDFVEGGGGLAVFHWPFDEDNPMNLTFPINPVLFHFGLSYTFCSITVSEDQIEVTRNFESAYALHFHSIINQFKEYLQKDESEIDSSDLENLVTTLKYSVIVSDDNKEDMTELGKICYNFLDKMNFSHDNTFEPDDKQIIILTLLQEIIPRMPAEGITPAKGYEAFPGVCEENDFEDFTMELEIVDEAWISTGLFLPAGTVGTVVTDIPYPNLNVQIGAHHESLLQKESPWKRWPLIISAFPLIETEVQVASPFGGPIYLIANEPLSETIKANFTFKHFITYPRSVKNDPSIWEKTKDKKVPFGEIECDHIILSMPTENIKQLDIEKVTQTMDLLSIKIAQFMCYPLTRHFRVVFDIDLESGASFGYPIVFLTSEIMSMFGNLDKPSMPLFTLCNMIGIVTIPEGCFDSTVEGALSATAASVAFKDLYSDFDPIALASSSLPPLFKELWKITVSYKDLIPLTLKKFQDPEYEIVGVPEDTWIEFVRDMCTIGKRDFTKILEKSRAIPLSVSMSCHNFPPYQGEN
ncbi:hypothetical protein M9Y10_034263 [Tritrichomonas musculus]|uniref:Peptidase M60 domain-containing protein n=1 Tax=Tritrichomonas musculus TaxID=1915356 RepID=A0ABR2KEF2_9EUKA